MPLERQGCAAPRAPDDGADIAAPLLVIGDVECASELLWWSYRAHEPSDPARRAPNEEESPLIPPQLTVVEGASEESAATDGETMAAVGDAPLNPTPRRNAVDVATSMWITPPPAEVRGMRTEPTAVEKGRSDIPKRVYAARCCRQYNLYD